VGIFRWLSRSRENDELDEELRFHLRTEAQLRIDRGEQPDAARRSACRDFGNLTLTQEVTREMWGWTAITRIAQDVRFAVRMLRKSPAFTALALGALALGIGATTAIFSVVDSILLKPLPFADPARLLMVWEVTPSGQRNASVQTQNFLDWRQRNRSFEAIAAMMTIPANLVADGEAVQVPSLRVSGDFFRILGVAPLLGRDIEPEDERFGADCVAVLGHGLWQRQFGSRPAILGQSINLGGGSLAGSSCRVIGIMPPGFEFPNQHADLYMPLQIDPAAAPRDGRNFQVVARLRPNTPLGAALADMRSIAAQTARERPSMNAEWSATVDSLFEETVGDSRTILLVLLGAAGFVLLIACANVANLLLMRASARSREMSVRIALGARRWRLLHQLTVESLLLAVAGGTLGFLMAWWGVPAILHVLPEDFPLPRLQEIAVNRVVLGFALAISLVCGLFFGIFPALAADRARVAEGLQQGRHGSLSRRTWRNLLVAVELAVAVLLVIGAGLMLRSFILLNQVDPGFRAERLITFRMLLSTPLDQHWQEHRAARVEQMLEGIRSLPMVSSASSIHLLPLSGSQSGSSYYRADRPAPSASANTGGDVSVISDGYFHTMGIAMIAGREFEPRDRRGSPPVAVLNQAAARVLFPGENPIGHRLQADWYPNPLVEIVGVAADVHHHGLELTPKPCLFLAQAQAPSARVSIVVRTSSDPAAAIAAIREQIHRAAPDQGIQDIATMEQLVSSSLARPKLQVTLMTIFGAVALALACLGVFAVLSYSIEQRTREIGIRLALGAAPVSILRLVLREGLSLAAAGIVAGLLAALLLTRYLSSLLYTVRPADPLVYAGVVLLLGLSAAAGCYVPARRATRVDPTVVLRDE